MRPRWPFSSPRPVLLLWGLLVLLAGVETLYARGYDAYDQAVELKVVFPGADRFGPMEGSPPAAVAYRGQEVAGYVIHTSDIGYSGKPIEILAGIKPDGGLVGARVLKHQEPILLVGIPEQKLFDFVQRMVGHNVMGEVGGDKGLDMISGATVTAIVIQDGVRKAGRSVLRRHNPALAAAETEKVTLVEPPYQPTDWSALLGEGSVRRLQLRQQEVDAAFIRMGVGTGEPYIRAAPPESLFIDFYAALVTPEKIGRNLLGNAEYDNLKAWLAPGQHALLLMANGSYSFRGSGFVRGGIFDRIKLVQEETPLLFRDAHYRRMGDLAEGFPPFTEIGLYKIPPEYAFDPARPWHIELLVQRPVGPIEKVFTAFNLEYRLPEGFLKREAVAPPPPEEPLWQRVWRDRLGDVMILAGALGLLTGIFFLQDILVRHPRLTLWLRRGFLIFSALWIGVYAQAQLSVVNVFTFLHALMSGFQWDFFLLEPLIFMLWSATAVSLLFWGRGAYCGWLCAFGAIHELSNWLARALGVRQLQLRFPWHERLWALKYLIFVLLLGISLHSFAMAEGFAEVEPFKTTILLRFMREWPFVVWAVLLLVAGLFVERFFCRYLCPLGAALAIPGRLRLFEWLKRRKQCGYECSLCARECMVQSIHPNGAIHPNECLYCLHCQVVYSDDTTCPPLIQRREKQKRRDAIRIRVQAARTPTNAATENGKGDGSDGGDVIKNDSQSTRC